MEEIAQSEVIVRRVHRMFQRPALELPDRTGRPASYLSLDSGESTAATSSEADD
jgi:hypothetical protein